MKEIASGIIVGTWIAALMIGFFTKTYEGKCKIDVVNDGKVTKVYHANEYDKLLNNYYFVDSYTAQKIFIKGDNINITELK